MDENQTDGDGIVLGDPSIGEEIASPEAETTIEAPIEVTEQPAPIADPVVEEPEILSDIMDVPLEHSENGSIVRDVDNARTQ